MRIRDAFIGGLVLILASAASAQTPTAITVTSPTLKAGEVLFIPAGTVHAAKNVGSDNAAEFATYIVEKGKPLLTLVK